VSRVLRPALHITGHFGDESLQAITCTGTDNTKTKYTKNTKLTLSTINKQENTKDTKTLGLEIYNKTMQVTTK